MMTTSKLVSILGLPTLVTLLLWMRLRRPEWSTLTDVNSENPTSPNKQTRTEVVDKNTDDESLEENEYEGDQCAMYLAESSIPNAGLGAFTAIDIRMGAEIGEPDLIVPVPDPDKATWSLWHDFVWNWDLTKDLCFENRYISDIYGPGLRSHINCHMGLNNVVNIAGHRRDAAGLHRSTDPSVGAFTNHYDMKAKTTSTIKAGSELFVSYGDSWFLDRIEQIGAVPLEQDFKVADRILQKVMKRREKLPEGFWGVIKNITDGRVKLALPENVDDIQHAASVGTARNSLPHFIRTPQWLKENGLCIDNLRSGKSTIKQAGRGAFAKRFLRQGSVVVPSPVIHLDRETLMMYKPLGQDFFTKEVIGKQLLLNYCFGHPDSSILLLPYAPIVNFINHNSDDPNVAVRWSSTQYQHQELLAMPASEVLKQKNGLLLDFVALRDIQPGEEILVDYGSEWEKAWSQHVQEWKPPKGSEGYIAASDFRKKFGNDIRTMKEQRDNPYPRNIQTACYYDRREPDNHKHGSTGPVLTGQWKPNADYRCLRPCNILSKYDVNGTEYVRAEMMNANSVMFSRACILPPNEHHIVSRIPANVITFVDREYSSDQHLPTAFRHEIGLPEGLFPPSWLDVAGPLAEAISLTPISPGESQAGSHWSAGIGSRLPKPVHPIDELLCKTDDDAVFVMPSLQPGEVSPLKWRHSEEIVLPQASLIGLPEKLTPAIRRYCEENGIAHLLRDLVGANTGSRGEFQYIELDGNTWNIEKSDIQPDSNMHCISPADAETLRDFKSTLGAGDINTVLDSIGAHFAVDDLVVYHVSFVAVSQSSYGALHHDYTSTGGKAFNIIVPLHFIGDSRFEVDIWSEDNAVGGLNMTRGIGLVIGDDACATHSGKGEVFIAATLHVAELNINNADQILVDYPKPYPPPEKLLRQKDQNWLDATDFPGLACKMRKTCEEKGRAQPDNSLPSWESSA